MTTRKPLVIVNGLQQELPAGDDPTLVAFLAAITQVLGDTSANILEVETATKAARVVYQPLGGGNSSLREALFDVGHYRVGCPVVGNANTAAITSCEMITMANPFSAGTIGILRKVTAGMSTFAVAGARLGLCSIQMNEIFAVYNMNSQAFRMIPPGGGGGDGQNTISGDYCSLNSKQSQPQLIVQRNTGGASVPAFSGLQYGVYINQLIGPAKSAIGLNIPPTVLFDHQVNGPFMMARGSGFSVTYTAPAAVTSQSLNGFVNVAWDEWQLKAPGY
jgi:hypothetical protein